MCCCNGPPRPQDLENLNSEEPASPTPSIPDPELCYRRLIAGSVPLSKWGLAWPKYRGWLPAHSHWRQSQERCPGSKGSRAAAAEDGGALGSLCECFHACTSTVATWETARAQSRGVEFTGSLRKTPKTLRGHALKTAD